MRKYILTPLIITFFLLLIVACQDPLNIKNYDNQDINVLPGGMGYVTISVTDKNNSRTLLPAVPSEFDRYKLTFTNTDEDAEPKTMVRYSSDMPASFELLTGTYTLKIEAQILAGDVYLTAAEGNADKNIVISNTEGDECVVQLYAIIDHTDADAFGGFSWDFDFSLINPSPDSGKITIKPLLTTEENDKIILLFGDGSSGLTGSQLLNTGYYSVHLELNRTRTNGKTKGVDEDYAENEEKIFIFDILHIYKNITTPFVLTLTEEYFNNTLHIVTFKFNNSAEDLLKTIIHNENAVMPSAPVKTGYYFDNWYTDDGALFVSANTKVIRNFNLNAEWLRSLSSDFAEITITGDFSYNGIEHKPMPVITHDYDEFADTPDLSNETYFTISYSDNINAGTNTASVTVTANAGSGYYGSITGYFTINPAEINIIDIEVNSEETKLDYIHGEVLDLSGLSVTLILENNDERELTFANFGTTIVVYITNDTDTVYITASTELVLSRSTHNGWKVFIHHDTITKEAGTLSIDPSDEAPEITFPAASTITYGQQLSSSDLTGGSTSFGTFAWTDNTVTPDAGTESFAVSFTPVNDDYYYTNLTGWVESSGTVVRDVEVTINKKPLAITGAATTKKYDGNNTIVGSLTLTLDGILHADISVETDEIDAEYTNTVAGTNTITITSVTLKGEKSENYSVTMSAEAITVTGGITKADGADVSGPPAVSTDLNKLPAPSSLTVDAVTILVNPGDQSVEYLIDTRGNLTPEQLNASAAWQAGTTFGTSEAPLNADTLYYVYARSQENSSYNAGTARVSAGILTAASRTLIIEFEQIKDFDGGTWSEELIISHSGYNGIPKKIIIELDDWDQYDSISWMISDTNITGSGSYYELDSENPAYNHIYGSHSVLLLVQRKDDARIFSINIPFTVRP